MEGSATKGLESNDCDAAQSSSTSSIVSRMYVEGYDTSLSGLDLVMSMEEHFGSCGEVLHVYIPGYVRRRILNRFALMYLRGEGAEEKASKLNGSCMGGHKLVVEPYPFHAKHLDHKFAPTRDADNKQRHMISVVGFDTSLPLEYAESMLYRELSDCGGLESVAICEEEENKAVLCCTAYVHVMGIDALENLVQLCGSNRIGLENIELFRVVRPEPDEGTVVNFDPTRFDCSPWVPHVDPDLPKPPCLGNLLPEPWKTKIGGEFPNLEAFPASTSRYAPEDPSLPKPWKALVDNSTGYGYFWNTETNVTQYQIPSSAPPHLLRVEKMTTQFTA